MYHALHIGTCANIQNSNALRDELLSALATNEKVKIDASELQEVDLSFFQTVYSANIYASKIGKSIEFTNEANEKLVAALVRTGLADLLPTANLNSWLHGGPSQ